MDLREPGSRAHTQHATIGAYRGHVRKKWLLILLAMVLLLATVIVSLTSGSSGLSYQDTLYALFGLADSQTTMIVWNLRMPRIITALVGGAGLALAGCAFQSVLRNPLASASTLGVSQGAAFGASVALVIFGAGSMANGSLNANTTGCQNPYTITVCAFLGSMGSTLVILALSRFKQIGPEGMILAGVALSALFSGATTLIQYFATDQQVTAVVFWTFGDLGRVSYRELPIISLVVLLAFFFFMVNRINYSAMESGEVVATSLGVNARVVRITSMAIGSLVASTIVSFVGIINFIGLIAPHLMRPLVGSDYRYLLPASGIAGAFLLLLSDLFARMIITPVVLPIGAITSFLGAPMFLFLLFKGVAKR